MLHFINFPAILKFSSSSSKMRMACWTIWWNRTRKSSGTPDNLLTSSQWLVTTSLILTKIPRGSRGWINRCRCRKTFFFICQLHSGKRLERLNLGPVLLINLQSKISLQKGIFLLRIVNFQNFIAIFFIEKESQIKIISCTDFNLI